MLYKQFITDDLTLGASQVPLYNLSSFFFFKLFGVSTYTLRLTSAIFAILTIFLSYLFLRKYNKDLAFWGALFLALNYQYFIFSRIGLVETFQSFFLLLTFFLLERKFWFAGGLSFALMISAKSLGIYMFPAVILYFLFKFIRKETKLRDVIKFSLGSLSIGILFVSYQYYFWEFFKVTIQQVSHSVGAGVLTHNLLSILFTIFAINTNGYLINPINVFLLILLLIYLGQIRFLNIFSRQGISYVRGLNSLDITMLSLFFGYIGILFHPASQRHMNLISVMLSFAPALVLFNNNKFEYFHEKMKWAKIIISLIPLFFLAKETLGFLSPYLRPYIKHPFLISMSASLIALVVLSFSYKYIPHKFKRMLITVSFVSLIFVVNLNTFNYMTEAFSLSIHTKLFLLLFLTLIYSSIFYLIYRNVNFVKLIYAISLSLILITLFTPRFSIRDGSLKLAQLTSEQDYVIGLEGHQLSYNAKYHPVWWWPNKYDTINNEFVKKVRPKYLIVIIKQWGKEVENGWPMPRERMLDHIGASSLEKIYTSGLYSIFGRYGYEYEVYKIIY